MNTFKRKTTNPSDSVTCSISKAWRYEHEPIPDHVFRGFCKQFIGQILKEFSINQCTELIRYCEDIILQHSYETYIQEIQENYKEKEI